MMERRGRRRNLLLDGFKEKIGYWKLKVEAQGRNMWVTRFGRECGHVVRMIKPLALELDI